MAILDDILAAYAWFDHPDGPKFVEIHRDEFRTSGHWLFLPGAFSSFHKVNNNAELWLIHLGRLRVHVLEPDGSHQHSAAWHGLRSRRAAGGDGTRRALASCGNPCRGTLCFRQQRLRAPILI